MNANFDDWEREQERKEKLDEIRDRVRRLHAQQQREAERAKAKRDKAAQDAMRNAHLETRWEAQSKQRAKERKTALWRVNRQSS